MKIIELVIDETLDDSGIDAISLVDEPAIESDFIALKSQRMQFKQVGDQRLLLGAALIPDKMIYRRDEERGEYHIYFSKATVKKAMELYMSRGFNRSFTQDHKVKVDGVAVIESWIVEDPERDKSSVYGFKVPKGTWMVAAKVYNDHVWQEFVKTGEVRGFSIEGYFADRQQFSHIGNPRQLSLLEEIEQAVKNHTTT
jgi:hypothetical protein